LRPPAGLAQQVIHVPADHPTITKAIKAACDGDYGPCLSRKLMLRDIDFLGQSNYVSGRRTDYKR